MNSISSWVHTSCPPTDRVDIAWTRQAEGTAGLATTILGENIQVLAVGGRLDGDYAAAGDDTAATSLTLLARPALALSLCQALQSGEVFLLARNRDDRAPVIPRNISSPLDAVREESR